MKYRAFLILFIVLFLAGTLVSAQRRSAAARKSSSDTSLARQFFPGANNFTAHNQPFPYVVASNGNTSLGYVILSEDLKLNIHGYGGPIPLAIAFSPEGMIINLKALPNNETPAYTGALEPFLRQFLNKTRQNQLELGKDIDAISRATVTSDSVASIVKAALHKFSTEVLKDQHAKDARRQTWRWRDILIPLALLALAWAALLLRNTALRWVTMAGGFLFFGLLTQTMLSIVQVANAGLLNVPDFFKNTLWFMTLAVAFIPALIIGRIYCGALCPFALVQELLPGLFRRKKRRGPAVSPKVDNAARIIKYLLLFGILALCFALGNASAANVEPFVTLFTSHNSKTAWALLLLMMILGIFHFRFWCIYLCPVGALTSLTASVSLWKIRAKDGCTRCGECASVCPTQAISIRSLKANSGLQAPASRDQLSIDNAECILCAKCLQSCKEGQLTLARKP
jgi:NAD-dependent dihydropyrimidine dehydrogenase PreA subunit/Na+-translocating ferredoxin:NAD+ oxidoreductase RnfG subunit